MNPVPPATWFRWLTLTLLIPLTPWYDDGWMTGADSMIDTPFRILDVMNPEVMPWDGGAMKPLTFSSKKNQDLVVLRADPPLGHASRQSPLPPLPEPQSASAPILLQVEPMSGDIDERHLINLYKLRSNCSALICRPDRASVDHFILWCEFCYYWQSGLGMTNVLILLKSSLLREIVCDVSLNNNLYYKFISEWLWVSH